MGLNEGRAAIETYFKANWTATAYGLDHHQAEVVAPFVRLTIQNGRVNQGSIGAYPLNLLHNIGAVMFSIWTAGGAGSAEANGYAETILSLFRYKTLDSAGVVVTSQAQAALIRFSPPELGFNGHPYISGRSDDPPHLMTTVTAPFVRYERD